MATIRKRQTKSGAVYDIQVRLSDKGSGKQLVRTTTWKPEPSMTPKQDMRINYDTTHSVIKRKYHHI